MITLELFEMKLMRTLKWLIAILIMQMKCRTSLMRNHEALSLGRSYPDSGHCAYHFRLMSYGFYFIMLEFSCGNVVQTLSRASLLMR